jgi:hypothetical protein
MYGTSIHLGCDVLERRIVLTASESDFVFSQGTITGYTGTGGVVDIPSTIGGVPVAVIGEDAFKDNATIKSLKIPDGVTLICDRAFFGMTALESARIGNGVTYIGSNAFYQNATLATVSLGSRITKIGDAAFAGAALTAVTIPASVTSIGNNAFLNNANLTSVTIANAKTSIGDSAFVNCKKLATVALGNGVTSIGDAAFSGDALTAVTIPGTVTSIGESAFLNNVSLKAVTFLGNAPTVDTDAFTGVAAGAKAIRAATLTGYGLNGSIWKNLIVTPPGRVAAPTVTVRTATLALDAPTITIKGKGFVANVPAANTVTFDNGAVGTVTAATATQLTVSITKSPSKIGPLKATVTTNIGGSSGAVKQVAKVVLSPI